ncbi:hypothetical protein ASD44_03705 [Mesorhizobium sp. Root554]|nr:hypothetical protein ASD27_03710 [Mesorhizobium sp. Root1471]KQZ35787.1 hypothetical protein ASD44_03705 [Mesorhizobium sp. Root554]
MIDEMIDYHSHLAVLQEFLKITGGTPEENSVLQAGKDDPDAAFIGAWIDHLVIHADSDGFELDLLEKAAGIWSNAVAIYGQLGEAQSGIEQALGSPPPANAADLVAQALQKLVAARDSALASQADIEALKASIEPLPHIRPHPRQQDVKEPSWDNGNRFLGRRTVSFLNEAFSKANSKRERAVCAGLISSYAGNLCGSAYLGTVVAGPRRLHRFRDRIARNAVGAHLHKTKATPKLSGAGLFGAAPGAPLPADIAAFLQSAFAVAYPGRSVPDFDAGYGKLIRHLQLLERFKRVDLPMPPANGFVQNVPPTDVGDILAASGIDSDLSISSAPDSDPTTPNTSDSKSSSGAGCILGILLIFAFLIMLVVCIVQAIDKGKCTVFDFLAPDPPDPRDPTTPAPEASAALTALQNPDNAAHFLQEIFNMRMVMWQGLDSALAYLAVTGLIYPDDLLMSSPLYQQFLRTPGRPEWPLRLDPQAEQTYHRDPLTAVENPAVGVHSQPFPPELAPDAFVDSGQTMLYNNVASKLSGSQFAYIFLRDLVKGKPDRRNRDLDADRGFMHECWDIADGTSINDPILSVKILPENAL